MNYKNEILQKKINIDELAELAHIALSAEDKQSMSAEMWDFVEFASCLAKYSAVANDQKSITLDSLRDDVAISSGCAGNITSSCQNFSDGLFCVPRTVKEDEE